jgi:hypothetical protein
MFDATVSPNLLVDAALDLAVVAGAEDSTGRPQPTAVLSRAHQVLLTPLAALRLLAAPPYLAGMVVAVVHVLWAEARAGPDTAGEVIVADVILLCQLLAPGYPAEMGGTEASLAVGHFLAPRCCARMLRAVLSLAVGLARTVRIAAVRNVALAERRRSEAWLDAVRLHALVCGA